MLRIGEWMKVQIGSVTAVGYVSNIVQYSWHGARVELTKVGWIIGEELEWRKPTLGMYDLIQIEPAGDLLDQFQDKSGLIDLALITKDEQWFKELMGGKQKSHHRDDFKELNTI